MPYLVILKAIMKRLFAVLLITTLALTACGRDNAGSPAQSGGAEDIPPVEFAVPDASDVVTAIDICMAEFDPDIIFTHHPFDTHQAHVGVSNATIAAARRRNTVFFYEPITPSGRSYVAFKPGLYVDIEDTIDQKKASLREHKSEYNKFGAEDWVTGIECRCGFRGYEIGKKYAEAFEILRLEMGFGETCSIL